MTFQDAVIEDQIDLVILIINQYLLLPGFKTEPQPHFKDELLKMVNNSLFEITLFPYILARQPQKLEDMRRTESSAERIFVGLLQSQGRQF